MIAAPTSTDTSLVVLVDHYFSLDLTFLPVCTREETYSDTLLSKKNYTQNKYYLLFFILLFREYKSQNL